jgi:hypothetical protein
MIRLVGANDHGSESPNEGGNSSASVVKGEKHRPLGHAFVGPRPRRVSARGHR